METSVRAKSETTARGLLPKHGAFIGACAVGAVALLGCVFVAPVYAVAIGANAMFATYLALTIYELPCLTPEFLRKRAADTDSPVLAFFAVAVGLVVLSVTFLFLALNPGGTPDVPKIVASVVSVLLGWFTVHTMAGLHYAYEYYDVPAASPGKSQRTGIVGGLDFPPGDAPDGWAFLYFSFVVGMTAQVSDVSVSSNAMRRLVLAHGVFSFLFNTAIVAATVNVVVAVAGS